jgi:hypothetical protein
MHYLGSVCLWLVALAGAQRSEALPRPIPATMTAATMGAEVRIEAIKGLGIEPAQRRVAQDGKDIAPDVALVAVARGQLQVGNFEPACD